jgi:large subunit ribosomal protein L35
MAKAKNKTHSGAKKRFMALKSGKVKRKQTRMRHLNSHMKSKVKRHLGDVVYVDDANMNQVKRCLGL